MGCSQVRMRQEQSARFDDFDFAAHNCTRYAGLENEIANCYVNPLVQVINPSLQQVTLQIS